MYMRVCMYVYKWPHYQRLVRVMNYDRWLEGQIINLKCTNSAHLKAPTVRIILETKNSQIQHRQNTRKRKKIASMLPWAQMRRCDQRKKNCRHTHTRTEVCSGGQKSTNETFVYTKLWLKKHVQHPQYKCTYVYVHTFACLLHATSEMLAMRLNYF